MNLHPARVARGRGCFPPELPPGQTGSVTESRRSRLLRRLDGGGELDSSGLTVTMLVKWNSRSLSSTLRSGNSLVRSEPVVVEARSIPCERQGAPLRAEADEVRRVEVPAEAERRREGHAALEPEVSLRRRSAGRAALLALLHADRRGSSRRSSRRGINEELGEQRQLSAEGNDRDLGRCDPLILPELILRQVALGQDGAVQVS